jgi:hypothetical protein
MLIHCRRLATMRSLATLPARRVAAVLATLLPLPLLQCTRGLRPLETLVHLTWIRRSFTKDKRTELYDQTRRTPASRLYYE